MFNLIRHTNVFKLIIYFMIDGISIETEILNFDMWRLKMPFEMSTPINTENGIIKSSKK